MPATSVERCRFEDNVLNTTGGGCLGVGEGGGSYHTVLVRDCAWRGNVINTTGADANAVASVMATQTAYSQVYFYDCTAAGNTVNASFSVATARACIASRAQTWGSMAFLNCAFADNAFTGSNASQQGEIAMAANHNTANRSFSFVNCAFDTSRDGHRPFCLGTACALYLRHCAITSFTDEGTGITTGTLVADGVSAESPGFARATKTRADGLFARGLSARSPFARSGFAVAVSADGWIFYYNPDNYDKSTWKPWVSIGPGTTCTAAQGEAQGLSLDNLLPDAFGRPRTNGRIAYGPLNTEPAATQITVR